MKHARTSWLSTLTVALALTITACGGGGQQGSGNTGDTDGETSAMSTTMEESTGGMSGGSMLMEDGEYYDKLFIDNMAPHHQGAVDMAEVALKNADHKELVDLSRNIIESQNAEIEELKDIKQEEFGTSEVPMEMSEEEMQMMGMTMDPEQLARQNPFDLAFMENMIPHHQSAMDMAEVALKNTGNPRIRNLAQEIISAQKAEIKQMRQWREEWYPQS